MAHWFTAWGTSDARSLWLAAVLLSMELPARVNSSTVMYPARQLVEQVVSQRVFDSTNRVELRTIPARVSDQTEEHSIASVTGEPGIAASAESAVDMPGTNGPSESGDLRQDPAFATTERAGLFFLAPVMRHLGMTEWLESHPDAMEQQIPLRVLHELASRLGTPPFDPIMKIVDIGRENDYADDSGNEIQRTVKQWLRQIRRWCRLQAKIGLFDVVCRHGRITASSTHVDIRFRLEQVDPRIRRAGLDIDPGWVPWLGRVIQFHYVSGEP